MDGKIVKTLHLIRHAESLHNENASRQRAETGKMVDPMFWDSDLSEKGKGQIKALNAKIMELGLRPEVILVSPLSRALQTALGGFEHYTEAKYIVHPLLAERVENACDIGSPKSEIIANFQSDRLNINFDLLQDDIWFYAPSELSVTPENLKEKFQTNRWSESKESALSRVEAVKRYIETYPATHFAVVGHSSFFKIWLSATTIMPNCHIETTYLTV